MTQLVNLSKITSIFEVFVITNIFMTSLSNKINAMELIRLWNTSFSGTNIKSIEFKELSAIEIEMLNESMRLHQNKEYWTNLISEIGDSSFLTGKSNKSKFPIAFKNILKDQLRSRILSGEFKDFKVKEKTKRVNEIKKSVHPLWSDNCKNIQFPDGTYYQPSNFDLLSDGMITREEYNRREGFQPDSEARISVEYITFDEYKKRNEGNRK